MILDVENFYGLTGGSLAQRFVLNGNTGYNVVGNYGRYGSGTSWGMLLQNYDSVNPYVRLQVSASNPVYTGAAFRATIMNGSNFITLFQFYQSTTNHVNIFLNVDGTVRAVNGSGTELGTFTIPNFLINTWYYFEAGVVIDNTSGSVHVRFNEQTIISASNVDTNNGLTGNVFVDRVGTNLVGYFGASLNVYHITDWYFTNSLGGNAATNGFLGDIRIVSQIPSSSGDQINFVPLSSTNVSNVNDGTAVDGDTTYVSASAVDSMDLYQTAAYTGSATTIYGINVKTYARKGDAGPRQYVNTIKSGSTLFYSATQSLSDTYVFSSTTFELNPNTSASWANVSEINGTQIGFKIVS